jgi:phytoene desaturase (3,4-didehydrolycopene-forming)
VKFLLGTSVKKIGLSQTGGRAVDVQLASGLVLPADFIAINADLGYVYSKLLPSSRHSQALQRRSTSCSSIPFYGAFNERIPELRPHNVFLANAYRESFDAIFDGHHFPDDFSFYVNVPSQVDWTAAPDGNESVMVLVPVSHLTSGGDEVDAEKKTSRINWSL